MNGEESRREKHHCCVKPDNCVVVVVIRCMTSVPMIHFVVIRLVEIGIVVTQSEKHFQEIYRVCKSSSIHHLRIIVIFENIGCAAVGVVIGIN